VSQNCNLVSEFNGLVSKRVNQQDWPFLLLYFVFFYTSLLFLFLQLILSIYFKDLFFEN